MTFGKHHFWLLPNLTEDMGFFDSFKPLYKHNTRDELKEKEIKLNKNPKSDDSLVPPEGDERSEENGEDVLKDEAVEKRLEGECGGDEVEDDNGYDVIEHEEITEQENVTAEEKKNV